MVQVSYDPYYEVTYPVPSKRGTYRVVHGGNGVSCTHSWDDTELYVPVEKWEYVILLCTAKEVVDAHKLEKLSDVGVALVSDDVLCLTRFGLLWIQGSQLEEI